ncbi:MAG: cytochrome c1 [Acidiferrobacteraceae bacterium]
MIRKRGVLVLVGALLSLGVTTAHAGSLVSPSGPFNKTTVIAGAKLFADHCSACHAVSNLRYNRLTIDLGMSKAEVEKDIMLPDGANYLKGMRPAMSQAEAKKWFGLPAPNLSHIVRAQGEPWVYTYLTSFYWDPQRPSGWNNTVFPEVAMPNVLASWGGIYTKGGKLLKAGSESPAAYHRQVAAIVAFLRYASDPSIFTRKALGPYVLGALVLLSIVSYLLKKAYWKDIDARQDVDNTSTEPKGKAKPKVDA